jgi:hypothetical protein
MQEGENTRAAMQALAERAAEQLEGTCKALYELGEEFEGADNSRAFCDRLDALVFECECCNWWHEQSEMGERTDERWICQQCTDDGE